MAETESSQASSSSSPNPPASSESVAAADGGEGAGSRATTGRQQGALTVSIPVVSTSLLAGAASLVNSPVVAVPVVAMPCIIAPAGLVDSSSSVGFTGQFAMTDQAVLATVTAQAQAQMQLQAGYTQTSDPYKPTISVPFNTTPIRQSSPVNLEENIISPKPLELPSSDQKPQSPHIVVKTTSSDGYNWRKYGQKQVKSSENSRSYFRCTNANCFAKKKVEHCQDGRVIEVIYRGQHNHSPPQKTKYSKQRSCESNGPLGGKTNLNNLRTEFNALDSCTSNKENDSCNEVPEQLHCSSDCEGDPGVNTEEDNGDEPDSKRRLCENSITISAPSFKTVREPKVVVQAACELGKVSDGYRWRKYGQKIVKGNPNPRSYYKCTNIGCPVRKHVEKALGDSKFVIITYEGQHNHDLPPSRNGNETSTSAPATKIPVDAREAVMTSDERMQAPGSLLDKRTQTECTSDKNGESAVKKAVELGGEMALESAETLLSIGCNITSEDNGKANNPDVVQRPLFNQACSAVSVQNA